MKLTKYPTKIKKLWIVGNLMNILQFKLRFKLTEMVESNLVCSRSEILLAKASSVWSRSNRNTFWIDLSESWWRRLGCCSSSQTSTRLRTRTSVIKKYFFTVKQSTWNQTGLVSVCYNIIKKRNWTISKSLLDMFCLHIRWSQLTTNS